MPKGIKGNGVKTGPVDQRKVRMSRTAKGRKNKFQYITAGETMQEPWRNKTAGTMMSQMSSVGGSSSWFSAGQTTSGYRSPYLHGQLQSATGDIPIYFIMMNENNGGLLYWPVTLRELYSWYRYFYFSDPYVGQALDLHTDLPMSKISLHMPDMGVGRKAEREKIKSFFQTMCDRIQLFEKLQSILFEYNVIGECFAFHEWDEKLKMWAKIVILPPEEVDVFQYPFSDDQWLEYRPERIMSIIKGYEAGEMHDEADINYQIYKRIPKEVKEMVETHGSILMDGDPMTGSFVHHLARKRTPYYDRGVSILRRVLIPLLMKEHFKYTQLTLSSRNMTPRNKVVAEGVIPEELDNLRAQLDLSMMDPDYAIVTNYNWDWQQIGAETRLLDLQREYDIIDQQTFAGLGITKELMTGEGMYSGSRITVEILNTRYLLVREILQRYVENTLFKPVAEAHGWYNKDANGFKKYWYPKLGFNRLTVRDNKEAFDSLFQLYQKGSLPIDVIYELFNLNLDELHGKIKSDVFTVKDSTFNNVLTEMNSEVGRQLVEQTDVVSKVAEYLKLKMKPAEGEEGGEEEMPEEPASPTEEETSSEEAAPAEEGGEETSAEEGGETEENAALIEDVVSELPADATDEQIQEAVNKKLDQEKLVESVVRELPADATDEQIQEAVNKKVEQNKIVEEVVEELPSGATNKQIQKVVQKKVDQGKIVDDIVNELPADATDKQIKDVLKKKMDRERMIDRDQVELMAGRQRMREDYKVDIRDQIRTN